MEIQSVKLGKFFVVVKECQRRIIVESVFLGQKRLIKIMWNVLFIINSVNLMIPLDTVCWVDFATEICWSHYAEVLKHYWTHVNIIESSGSLQAVVRVPIERIPEEIWGLQPAIIAPRFIDQRWEACFIIAELRIKRFAKKHSQNNVPYQLQMLILCFYQNVFFKKMFQIVL